MTVVAVLIAGLVLSQTPPSPVYDIRPGPADQAINRLAEQAGIDVVVAADLRGRRSQGLAGRMPAGTALDRLLAPMGLRAVRIGEGMYRVETAPTRPAPPRQPRAEALPPANLGEILVTAAPPVGLSVTDGRRPLESQALLRAEGSAASDAIADLSATVDSTRQGTGRDKLFIRGLADSAMNGPLQATVGQYLGDLRLSYGSPDPDLTLIDIGRVEVFEGPQGTRFGAGSIGEVVRLHPNPPGLHETSARYLMGASATSGGAGGGKVGLIANRPLGDRTAVRMVAYARRDGGFLDRPEQGLRHVDTVDTVGGRLILRWTDDAWTVDLVAQAQSVSADDGQAVPVGANPQARATRAPEPYDSAIMLGGITAHRRFGPVQMTAATSLTRQ